MKKIIIMLVVFSFIGFQISGCTLLNSKFDTKANIGMFSGCLSGLTVGWILMGNPCGGALGCMLGTAFGTFIGEHYDKKLGTREEALMKYRLRDDEEKLLVEESLPIPQLVTSGSLIYSNIQYIILAPANIKKIKITETRLIFNERDGLIKLSEREVFRTQGTHSSIYKFRMPENISKGDIIIITVISNDKQTKTIMSPMKIV